MEKVILKETVVSGDTKNNKKYSRNRKPKNKVENGINL